MTKLTPEFILKTVSDETYLTIQQIKSKIRDRSRTQARFIFCNLTHRFCNLSLKEIGGHVGGIDHSSVIHGLKIHNETLYGRDAKYTEMYDKCFKIVNAISDNAIVERKSVINLLDIGDVVLHNKRQFYGIVINKYDNHFCVQSVGGKTHRISYYDDINIFSPKLK